MTFFEILFYYIRGLIILTIFYHIYIHYHKYKHYIFNYNCDKIYNDLHTIYYLIKSKYNHDFIMKNIISYLHKNNNHLENIIFECIIQNKYKLLKKILLSSNIYHQKLSINYYLMFINVNNLDYKYKSFTILLKNYDQYLDLNQLNNISYNQNCNKCLKYLNKYNIDYSNFIYNRSNPIIIYNYINYYNKNNFNISHIIKYYIRHYDYNDIKIIKNLFNNLYNKYLKYEKIINDIIIKCNIQIINYILMKLNKLNLLKKYIKYIRYTTILNKLNNIIDDNYCNLDKYYWNIFLLNSRSLNIINKNKYNNLLEIINKYNKKIDIRSNEIKKLYIINNDIIDYCIKKYL